MKNLRKGSKVAVEGRFIPESKIDEILSGKINQNYPQIILEGKIDLVMEDKCVVSFDNLKVEMEISNEDLLFPQKQ